MKPSYVYVTLIKTTPADLWKALTDGDITKRYWGNHRNRSDWKVGSPWTHEDYDNAELVDVMGTVIESDPPNLLVITWAAPQDADNNEKISRVTFKIEKMIEAVKLTVVHDDLEPESSMQRAVTGGWPMILSSLKSYLETGKALVETMSRCNGEK